MKVFTTDEYAAICATVLRSRPKQSKPESKPQPKQRRRRTSDAEAITQAIQEARSHGCANPGCGWCGIQTPRIIDLHHVDPRSKSFSLSLSEADKRSLPEVLSEIDKCVPLCLICHRLVHANMIATDDIEAWKRPKHHPPQ